MPERHQPLPAPIVTLMMTVAVVGCNSLVLSPILRDVAAGLGASEVAVSRAGACYGAATALAALATGPHLDRLGWRRALRAGVACLLAAVAASAISTDAWMLAAAQALAGVGAGAILPSAYAMATAGRPPAEASRALGRVLTGWSLSLVLGVPASGIIADRFGWRACFLLLAVLCAVLLVALRQLPSGAAPRRGEARPGLLMPVAIPGVPSLLLICLAFMSSFYGVYAFLGDHVRAALGIGAARASWLVLSYGLGFGVASLGDGWLQNRRLQRVFPLILAGLAAIYLAMPWATQALPRVVALTALWGLLNHYGLNAIVLLLGEARPSARAPILALNSAVTYLGALVGVGGAGLLYGSGGFAVVCWSAAALSGATVLVALMRPRVAAAVAPVAATL